MKKPEAVREIVETNRGRIIGKTRLQKTTYFLESFGIGYGFNFKYHYYGPYSEDLTIATDDARALDFIDLKVDTSNAGTKFTVFETKIPSAIDNTETFRKRQELLNKLQKYDTTSLELAATADFLEKNGFRNDPWLETRRRKSLKATTERIERAKQLLSELRKDQRVGRISEA